MHELIFRNVVSMIARVAGAGLLISVVACGGTTVDSGSGGSLAAPAGSLPGSDQTPPTVSVSAPAPGATVSGSITVRANASDNVGVAGVRFRVDGVDTGAEDTVSPYRVTWDTTQVPNGQYVLTAVARDGAGNQALSPQVTVTVNNASSQGSARLTWAPNAETDLAGYRVYYGTASGQYQQGFSDGIDVGNATTYVVNGLASGTQFYFAVTAYDAAGNESVYSTEVAYVVP